MLNHIFKVITDTLMGFASSSDNSIRIFDLNTRKVTLLSQHTDSITFMARVRSDGNAENKILSSNIQGLN